MGQICEQISFINTNIVSTSVAFKKIEGFVGILSTQTYIACVQKIVVMVGWRMEVSGGSGSFAGILSTQTWSAAFVCTQTFRVVAC